VSAAPKASGPPRGLPLGPAVSLIAQDRNGLVAFAKPAGVLSHPNGPKDHARSLLTCRYEMDGEFFEWPAEPGQPSEAKRLWLLNRLDSGTSGVILGATSEALAKEIRALFLRKTIRKLYNALVFGVPPAREQTWHDRVAIEKRGGHVRTQVAAGNIPAEAHMRLLRSRRDDRLLSLIELEPKTGRSHQLRVQCAKRHLPIVGDATYGNFPANREFAKATGEKRLFLHSLETRFEYDFGGRKHAFTAHAPLPKEFAEVLGPRP
jgi:23S rRNA-/tRNA-specific pseudouridylate synthase